MMKLMNQNHMAVVEYVRHGCRLHKKSAECRFKNSQVGVLCPAHVRSCDVHSGEESQVFLKILTARVSTEGVFPTRS
jgi:hypothetical protein